MAFFQYQIETMTVPEEDKDLWQAMFTVFWFASGEEIMAVAKNKKVASQVYNWFREIENKN